MGTLIMNGGLIQSITFNKLCFQDALNFFNAPLASLPKMMGTEGAKKGYFPHFFNTLQNQDYIRELSHVEDYSINNLLEEKRKALI